MEANDIHITEMDGVISDRLLHNGDGQDEDLAAMSNRILTVRNVPVPTPPIPSLTHSFSTPTDLAHVSSPQNIIGRRNASRTQARPANSDSLTPKPNDSSSRTPEFSNHLRPITPTESLSQDQNVTLAGLPSGQEATELLASDGPMTPTNNAGPFVFDGSAGRAAGRRAMTSLAPETESTA